MGDITLPVQLQSFTALAGDKQVVLNWATESEKDNEAFLLQRSEDGLTFERLAEIDGQGTSTKRTNYEYTDHNVYNGRTYYYRLGDCDLSGVITWHNTLQAMPNSSGIDLVNSAVIKEYAIYPAYPNPFNPETTIRFAVPNTGNELKNISLNIVNLLGQKVATLYDGPISGGEFSMKWDGTNDQGSAQPSGVYLVHFQSDQVVKTQKVTLIR